LNAHAVSIKAEAVGAAPGKRWSGHGVSVAAIEVGDTNGGGLDSSVERINQRSDASIKQGKV